jgi:SPP1 family predicted phage head-tail adaptor
MMRCCDINSGMLREPVTFQRQTRTTDGAGGQTQTWAAISGSPSRAYVTAASGSERYLHDRVEATVRLKLVTRYNSGLLESDRVLIRNKAHNIRFIKNVEFRNQWLEILVDGGVAS